MVKQTRSITALLSFLLFAIIAEGERAEKNSNGVNNCSSIKLFVFGDSYVDTGNSLHSPSYTPPYGITFPGKPAGRFCDGRVLTDYVASFFNISSPTPYESRNSSEIQCGMNFAHGGTGIFNTLVDGPNMTVQIDLFEKLIQQNVYTKQDLESSVALVNSGGNDYLTFAFKNGSMEDVPVFTASLVKQMSINLKRVHTLGVGKIALGLLEPLGCFPLQSVASSYEKCVDTTNLIASNHSQMLLQTVQQLNRPMGKSVFVALDLYNSFLSIIDAMQKKHAKNSRLMNPLEPCCAGVSVEYSCGSVDEKGAKKYNICAKPELSFFWDTLHPSQNAWGAVYEMLKSSLHQLIY